MRIFYIGATSDQIKEIQKYNHEILYWVGISTDKIDLPGTIFHDHYAAWAGASAIGLDVSDFPPPSKQLIKSMSETETLVLTMMNKRFDKDCIDKRRNLYYTMLQYWNGVIEKYNPELIIFPIVPHTVYNYVIYELAKLKGIKTVMFEDTWVSDRLIMYADWRKGSEELKRLIEKNKDKDFSIDDLSEDIKEYYLSQINPKTDSTPIYMKHWANKFSKFNVILRKIKLIPNVIKDKNRFKRIFHFIGKQFTNNLKKEYESLQVSSVDLDKKFVYVPLNFQPERTTSPQGDIFVDQILMIKTLAYSLPEGWYIYVKEHPSQWWLRSGVQYSSARYPGYYEKISQIKNVKLLTIDTNSFELIAKSQAIATVTGTAGWESILRSKPVMVFGYPWYRDFSEIFRINNVEDCSLAFQKISQGFTISQQKVINFLYSFDSSTMHGYIESFVNKISKVTASENVVNITNKIINYIKEI